MAPEIVGRDEELAALHRFVARQANGPAALVLSGEAGIGKSTLWRAGVEAARERGLRVLAARPAEVEQGLVHAALGDLLGPCADEVLPELSPPRRRALEAALLLGGDEGLPAEPRALGVAVHAALLTLAARGPILVAVDDVQWLDPPSAAALSFALRRLDCEPVRVLLARRGDRVTTIEPSLPDGVTRLSVGPLSLGALQGLLRDRLGRSFSRPTMRRLHELSGGNPFYALEVGRALAAEPVPLDPAEPLPVPPSLEQLVGERLRVLPEATRTALLVVAVVGSPAAAFVEAAGIADEILSPAVAAQVLELANGEVRFTHPLLASGVIAAATEAERRDAHRLAAAAVEEPVARARHVAAALEEPDDDVASLLEEAAGLAQSRGAPSVAAELAEAAARATPREREDDRRRRVILAARQHLAAGSGEHALVLARMLLGRAEPGPPRAEALLLLGDLETEVGTLERAVANFRAALTEAAGWPALEQVIEERLASYSRVTDGLAQAGAHAQTAVRLAELLGDDAVTARALAALAVVRFDSGEPGSFDIGERAVALAERATDESAMREVREDYGHCLVWSGRLDEARAIFSSLVRSAERLDLNPGNALFYLCRVEERAGRLALARALAERHAELAQQDRGRELPVAPPVLWSIGRVAALQGDLPLARELAERALAHPDARVPYAFNRANRAQLGILDAWCGDSARAVERFAAIEVEARADGGAVTAFYLDEYVEALLEVGRLEDAGALLALFEADTRKLGHRWGIAQAVRCRGLAAAAAGDIGAAVDLLEHAVVAHEAVGDPFGRARALLALGVARRRARQKRSAQDAIKAALDGFEAIGAAGWAENARTELGHIGGRQREDGLTPAEQRVAALVAQGRTNREVAAALFLGERTVETHLTHVYAKLGIRSRTELARTLS